MFNMQQIGKKITELRKANNMTQMALADQLGISFQAVSNWERGNTMPDISKLPELSAIFHVSMDELLSGDSSLLTSVMEGTVDTYIEEGNLTEEAIADALPLLEPKQVDNILEKADILTFENISMFLPFLDEDSVAEFARKAQEKGENITQFLPHMDEDTVAELARKAQEKGESVTQFLPHMDEDDIAELARKAQEKGENITQFLPHMDEDDIAELANRALDKGENVQAFLPFMEEADVAKLAIRALTGK